MSKHVYQLGRLNLPFVGHYIFGKHSPNLGWDNINADVAVLSAPSLL